MGLILFPFFLHFAIEVYLIIEPFIEEPTFQLPEESLPPIPVDEPLIQEDNPRYERISISPDPSVFDKIEIKEL